MLYDIILSIKISIIIAIIKIIYYLYINMIINYKYSKSLFLNIINDIFNIRFNFVKLSKYDIN